MINSCIKASIDPQKKVYLTPKLIVKPHNNIPSALPRETIEFLNSSVAFPVFLYSLYNLSN